MSTRACEHCTFCHSEKVQAGIGPIDRYTCRRYPPKLRRVTKRFSTEKFPHVSPFWWCGEFKPRALEIGVDLADGPDKTVEFALPATCPECPRCPKCGYTAQDAAYHGDHRVCGGPEPAPCPRGCGSRG